MELDPSREREKKQRERGETEKEREKRNRKRGETVRREREKSKRIYFPFQILKNPLILSLSKLDTE
jgi:hypothetical protein